ncbi:hypothetical protein PCE1_001183 [Barthelona sp. PCE]
MQIVLSDLYHWEPHFKSLQIPAREEVSAVISTLTQTEDAFSNAQLAEDPSRVDHKMIDINEGLLTNSSRDTTKSVSITPNSSTKRSIVTPRISTRGSFHNAKPSRSIAKFSKGKGRGFSLQTPITGRTSRKKFICEISDEEDEFQLEYVPGMAKYKHKQPELDTVRVTLFPRKLGLTEETSEMIGPGEGPLLPPMEPKPVTVSIGKVTIESDDDDFTFSDTKVLSQL